MEKITKMSFPQSVSGNPDVVPAKAGSQTKELDSCLHRKPWIPCQTRNDKRKWYSHVKKVISILVVILLSLSFASTVFSAGEKLGNFKKGVINEVNAREGVIVFSPSDSRNEMTLKVDSSVELDKVKPGDRVIVTLDKKDGIDIARKIETMFIDLGLKALIYSLRRVCRWACKWVYRLRWCICFNTWNDEPWGSGCSCKQHVP